jgi:hypothetical protein
VTRRAGGNPDPGLSRFQSFNPCSPRCSVNRLYAIPAALVVGIAAGCATVPVPVPAPGDAIAAPSDYGPTSVVVSNSNLHDAEVYAYRGGVRFHIGFVPSGSTQSLVVRPGLFDPGHAQLYVYCVGAPDSYLSDVVDVNGGGRAVLHLLPVLNQSTLIVVSEGVRAIP